MEVPLSTISSGEKPFNISAIAYNADGSMASPTINWKVIFDFNASDANNSRMAQLEGSDGLRGTTATGEQVKLLLYSTLRKEVGSIDEIEILSGGTNYSVGDKLWFSKGYGFDANITEVSEDDGAITQIQIHQRGFDIPNSEEILILDENLSDSSSGAGAVLRKKYFSGNLTLEANATMDDGQILSQKLLLRSSSNNLLTDKEKWLDKYLDSLMPQDSDWWTDNAILDDGVSSDGLENEREFYMGTNPLSTDTDLDGRTDSEEFSTNALGFTSNPLLYDTDGDGWNDSKEYEEDTNPRLKDTDRDGIPDPLDLEPTNPSGDGVISGRIFKLNKYGNNQVVFRFQKI